MFLSEKNIKVINECYVVKPKGDLKRFYCEFYGGEAHEIDDIQSGLSDLGGVIYLKKKTLEEFKRVLREIEIEMKKSQIFGASLRLAEATIAYVISSRSTKTVQSSADLALNVIDVNVSSYVGVPSEYILWSTRETMEAFLLGVTIGRFSLGGLANVEGDSAFKNALRGTSIDSFDGFFWIKKIPEKIKMLKFSIDCRKEIKEETLYRALVSRDLGLQFFKDFRGDMKIPSAIGAGVINIDYLKKIKGLTLMTDFGGRVSESGSLFSLGGGKNFPDDLRDLAVKDRIAAGILRGNPLSKNRELDNIFNVFSDLILRAKSHIADERFDEGFLLLIVALDVALGGEKGESTTKNVKGRTAAIHAYHADQNFKDTEKEVSQLYEARSRYVHAGKSVPSEKIDLLLHICSEVALTLLHARNFPESGEDSFIAKYWHPVLDLIVSAHRADLQFTDDRVFRRAGLIKQALERNYTSH